MYLENKYQLIFEKYKKNNLAHCLWEVLMTVQLENEQIRAQIVDGILTILTLPACKLYGLTTVTRVLIRLLQAYYDYKFPQFRKSLENQFAYFYGKL